MISQSLRALLLLVLGMALVGCGPTSRSRLTSGSTSLSSTDSPTTVSGVTSGGQAQCNAFSGASVAGKVTAAYSGNSLLEDRVRVRLSTIPLQFSSSSSATLKFFRWKAAVSGSTELDSTPLSFLIEKSGGGAISGVMTSLNSSELATFRQAGSIPGTTAQEFFNNTVLIVTGTDYDWQAMKVVFYDGATAIAQTDALLPVFTANPNVYGTTHAPVLNGLHPFWNNRSQSLSDSQWAAQAQNFCF